MIIINLLNRQNTCSYTYFRIEISDILQYDQFETRMLIKRVAQKLSIHGIICKYECCFGASYPCYQLNFCRWDSSKWSSNKPLYDIINPGKIWFIPNEPFVVILENKK